MLHKHYIYLAKADFTLKSAYITTKKWQEIVNLPSHHKRKRKQRASCQVQGIWRKMSTRAWANYNAFTFGIDT